MRPTPWPAGCSAGRRRGASSHRRGATSPSTSEGPRTHLHVQPDLDIPLAEITLRASRSSGPGGQHANVTASRVEAVFDVLGSRTLSDSQRARLLDRAGSRVV